MIKKILHTYLLKVIAYLAIVFTPLVPALLWLGVFVFFDLITGIYKAKKAKESIQSKKLRNTVTKVMLYFIAIIAGHVMDIIFLAGWPLPFTIAQAIIGFIGIAEFKSIIENISSVLGMDLFKFLKSKIEILKENAKQEQE